MVLAANLWGIPTAPTILFVAVVVIIILWLLWRDTAPVRSLQREVDGLRKSLALQSKRHTDDMAAIRKKMGELEDENVRQRSLKHKATGDLAKAVIALDLVRRLADECVCERQPLAPLRDIITRLFDEMEMEANRRADDPT